MEEEIKRAKKQAFALYKKLSREKVYCRALKCVVRISETGFKHLTEKARYPKDKLYRLKIFAFVPEVITFGKHVETRREKGVIRHSVEAVIDSRVLRVIVQEDAQGKLFFYSIMDKT